jgi:hypothetical protein
VTSPEQDRTFARASLVLAAAAIAGALECLGDPRKGDAAEHATEAQEHVAGALVSLANLNRKAEAGALANLDLFKSTQEPLL